MSYLDFFFLKRTNHILLSLPLYFYGFPLYTMVLFSLLYSIGYFKGSMMAEYVSYGSIFAFSTLLSYDINNVLSKYCVKQEILNKSFFSLDFPAFTASVTFCAFNFQLISLRLHTNICKYFLLKYRAYKVSLMS